jgi:phosphatidylinositol alpha-mannosyltransferase
VRVALACPYAWDDPGGVQVHIRELAGRLLENGHEVQVLAPARHAVGEPWVRVIGRPVNLRYNASSAPIDPRPWSYRIVRDSLKAFRPDVLHAHEPETPSTSMWATLASHAPVVATFHSGAEGSRFFAVAAPLIRRVARRIVVRIAVSRAAERFVAPRIGGSFQIVPNGVDVDRFANALPADLGPGRKLLFVGRLDERKGFPTAVGAFANLAVERPDLRLIVAGDGPERSAIDALTEGARDRVWMLGAVANTDLPQYHAACDLFLGTSIGGESFGIVLVEAMAAGLPVVASDIPGYDEVVRDGLDGMLVPPRDPAALAVVVGSILDDPDLAARLSDAGRTRARAFDWATVTTQLMACYEQAIALGPLR